MPSPLTSGDWAQSSALDSRLGSSQQVLLGAQKAPKTQHDPLSPPTVSPSSLLPLGQNHWSETDSSFLVPHPTCPSTWLGSSAFHYPTDVAVTAAQLPALFCSAHTHSELFSKQQPDHLVTI